MLINITKIMTVTDTKDILKFSFVVVVLKHVLTVWHILCMVLDSIAPPPCSFPLGLGLQACIITPVGILEISNGRTILLNTNIHPTVAEFDAQVSLKHTCRHWWLRWVMEAMRQVLCGLGCDYISPCNMMASILQFLASAMLCF